MTLSYRTFVNCSGNNNQMVGTDTQQNYCSRWKDVYHLVGTWQSNANNLYQCCSFKDVLKLRWIFQLLVLYMFPVNIEPSLTRVYFSLLHCIKLNLFGHLSVFHWYKIFNVSKMCTSSSSLRRSIGFTSRCHFRLLMCTSRELCTRTTLKAVMFCQRYGKKIWFWTVCLESEYDTSLATMYATTINFAHYYRHSLRIYRYWRFQVVH